MHSLLGMQSPFNTSVDANSIVLEWCPPLPQMHIFSNFYDFSLIKLYFFYIVQNTVPLGVFTEPLLLDISDLDYEFI